MIQYFADKRVDYDRLIALFDQAGWQDKTGDMDRLKAMVENSQIVITAWDKEKMVGFARCTTDYIFNGQINNVVVDEGCRGHGIGKELIHRILGSSPKVTYLLRADNENVEFYKSLGFVEASLSMVYRRRG